MGHPTQLRPESGALRSHRRDAECSREAPRIPRHERGPERPLPGFVSQIRGGVGLACTGSRRVRSGGGASYSAGLHRPPGGSGASRRRRLRARVGSRRGSGTRWGAEEEEGWRQTNLWSSRAGGFKCWLGASRGRKRAGCRDRGRPLIGGKQPATEADAGRENLSLGAYPSDIPGQSLFKVLLSRKVSNIKQSKGSLKMNPGVPTPRLTISNS